jgi:hypothetical protein
MMLQSAKNFREPNLTIIFTSTSDHRGRTATSATRRPIYDAIMSKQNGKKKSVATKTSCANPPGRKRKEAKDQSPQHDPKRTRVDREKTTTEQTPDDADSEDKSGEYECGESEDGGPQDTVRLSVLKQLLGDHPLWLLSQAIAHLEGQDDPKIETPSLCSPPTTSLYQYLDYIVEPSGITSIEETDEFREVYPEITGFPKINGDWKDDDFTEQNLKVFKNPFVKLIF